MKAFAVMPRTPPSPSAVMTVTPVANAPITRRNSPASTGGLVSFVVIASIRASGVAESFVTLPYAIQHRDTRESLKFHMPLLAA
jgi:hypothetical protein